MKTILQFILLLFTFGGSAQSITQYVFASSGTTHKINNISIQWTLGEVAIRSEKVGGVSLSEGFHQFFFSDQSTPVSAILLGEKVLLYPNPIDQELQLSIDYSGTLQYRIYDFIGTLINKGRFQQHVNIYVGDLGKGAYFIELIKDNNQRGIYSFIKT